MDSECCKYGRSAEGDEAQSEIDPGVLEFFAPVIVQSETGVGGLD